MRRSIVLVAISLTALSLGGCRAKKALDQAAIATDLNNRGTMDLMKETEKDQYTPPSDGHLTDAQVKIYLKVREHEKDIAKVARQQLEEHSKAAEKSGDKSLAGMMEGFKGLGSIADIATADIRAAKDLGYNTKEYQWIKGQILAASTAQMQQKVAQASVAITDSSYQQMKKQYDEARDDATKKAYGDMLASMEKTKQETAAAQTVQDPAVAYNLQLLSKYDTALNAFGMEMAKYETKDGEAQKGMQEFQQGLDKAVADAQKQAAAK